ncbi:hypothetical protein PSCICM_30700 [Pseudomonas cichorii]|uniref:Uncharacterized protein n=1 Tax=Pseudomonas cichorii TaxID=36746 RepID=A0ABQ1DLZ5_PSECI|nr:hypothetical protein PSCICM_30700 [Pseudomonas cichorii]GFM91986.1 hypothetical protein PSCICP_19580 [Pseudomonas cichorii]
MAVSADSATPRLLIENSKSAQIIVALPPSKAATLPHSNIGNPIPARNAESVSAEKPGLA